MISQYTLYDIGQISRCFAPDSNVPKGVRPRYNINPTDLAPVIVSREGIIVIEQMKWGLVPTGAKDTNSVFRYKTYNAKSEDVFRKASWSRVVRDQRCLVPANGFYMYRLSPSGEKNPYYIHPSDRDVFCIAAVYNSWTDPSGNTVGTFSILTVNTESDSELIPSRLPVIVATTDEADWLDPSINDMNSIYRIMKPYDLDKLTIIRVGEGVKSSKNDDSQLIEKLAR